MISVGEFNRNNFSDEGYEMFPVIIFLERKWLNQNLMLLFTVFTRFSLAVQKANVSGNVDKIVQLKEMLSLVDDVEKILMYKVCDLDDFGRMLAHTWKLKCKTRFAVDANSIDEFYAKRNRSRHIRRKTTSCWEWWIYCRCSIYCRRIDEGERETPQKTTC